MDRFVSTFRNKIDAKSRVSIPASFRAVLDRDRYAGATGPALYCYPSIDNLALDAGGERLAKKIDRVLDRLPDYSEQRDEVAVALYGDAHVLAIDADGRIVLSKELRQQIGLPDGVAEIAFVGLGDKFQLWEPARFDERRSLAREKMREHRAAFNAGRRPGTPDDGVE